MANFISNQGMSLGEVAARESTKKPWSDIYTDEFFKLKQDFDRRYGGDFWGLNFDPAQVPDDELFNYLNAYQRNVDTTGRSGIPAIHAASELFGLNDATTGDAVRESLLKGSEYQFREHGPTGKLIQTLAPALILGAGAALTGGFGLSGLLKGANATGVAAGGTPQFLASTAAGGTGAASGVAGSTIANLSAQGLLGTGALSGTAAGSGSLLSSILNTVGGSNVSPMNTVISEVIKKVPSLVDSFFEKDQAGENTAFLESLLRRNNPDALLSAFEGSKAYKDFDKILNDPEGLTIFNSIMDRASRQANRTSAKSGTLPPGTGQMTGGYGDLLSRLILENAGAYHANILNSLPVTSSANLISNSLNPQLSLAEGVVSQRNVEAASNPLRVIFGGGANTLVDNLAELFT